MGKKQIRRFTVILAALLLICTFYSRSYERVHTLRVKTGKPQWTEERMLLLPKGALLDGENGENSCVWTVKDVVTVWGLWLVLEKEEITLCGEENGCILAEGLLKGVETRVVTGCEEELRPGSRAVIEE